LPADLDELAQRIKEEHSNVGSALQQGFIRDVNVPSGGSAAFLGISGGTLNVSLAGRRTTSRYRAAARQAVAVE